MTPATTASFYVTGGNVPPDSLSYVPRKADTFLLEHLLQGEFCYILTSRQMGKSSLMAQTVRRLREHDIAVVVLDLSAQGYNLTAEQWYNGLLEQLGRRLKLEDSIEDYVDAHAGISPLQRWQYALLDVVLREISGQVVIFIDEIDVVRSLPFSTDEFFAAIRACFNGRAEEASYQRLTFCLMGVATPPDLITNPDLTPFNIGTRIDLEDFTPEEASLLQHGLGRDAETCRLLMQRIYHWTHGHPCLTQRLCKAVAEDTAVLTEAGVDRLCQQIFLAPTQAKRDDNLAYVRQRVLPDEDNERASLLNLYRLILEEKIVPDNEADALVSKLKLSGIVCARSSRLHVRNPIYAHVFNRAWIAEQMPHAEQRRQRKAYLKGVMRAAIAGAVLLFLIGSMYYQKSVYAEFQRQHKHLLETFNYTGDVFLAQKEWESGEPNRAISLIDGQIPKPGERDIRGFEWRWMWEHMHRDRQTWQVHKGLVFSLAVSPDGKRALTGSFDQSAIVWDPVTGRQVKSLPHSGKVTAVAWSNDRKWAATAESEAPQDKNFIRIWDTKTWQSVAALPAGGGWTPGLTLSPDGRLVGVWTTVKTTAPHGLVRVWDVRRQRQILNRTLVDSEPDGNCLAFSPDARSIYFAANPNTIDEVDLVTRHTRRSLHLPDTRGQTSIIFCLALSHNGRYLAAGTPTGPVFVFDLKTGGSFVTRQTGSVAVHGLAFSPDDTLLAAASWDARIYLWSAPEWKALPSIRGHRSHINAVVFGLNRDTLLSVSNDRTLRVWSVREAHRVNPQVMPWSKVDEPFFSPSGRTIVTTTYSGTRKVVRLWDTGTLQPKGRPIVYDGGGLPAPAPDDRTIAFASGGRICLVDGVTGKISNAWPISDNVNGYLTYSPDGRSLAITTEKDGCNLVVLDTLTRRELLRWRVPGQAGRTNIRGLPVFSTDSQWLAAGWEGETSNNCRLWSLVGSRPFYNFDIPFGTPIASAFSANGLWLAQSGWQGTVVIWDIASKREVKQIPGHGNYVDDLAFSPDGRTLVTCGHDGSLKVWSTLTWREVLSFKGDGQSGKRRCRFTEDGRRLAVAGPTGLMVFTAPTLDEIAAREK